MDKFFDNATSLFALVLTFIIIGLNIMGIVGDVSNGYGLWTLADIFVAPIGVFRGLMYAFGFWSF